MSRWLVIVCFVLIIIQQIELIMFKREMNSLQDILAALLLGQVKEVKALFLPEENEEKDAGEQGRHFDFFIIYDIIYMYREKKQR